MQLTDIPKFLDDILYAASKNNVLGDTLVSPKLLQQSGCPVTMEEGLFLIDMLLEDGYLKHVIEGYSSVPVVTLTSKGVRFIAMGGYVGHYSNENEAIKKEQVRLNYEIKHLKWANFFSALALVVSAIALMMTILNYIHNG